MGTVITGKLCLMSSRRWAAEVKPFRLTSLPITLEVGFAMTAPLDLYDQ